MKYLYHSIILLLLFNFLTFPVFSQSKLVGNESVDQVSRAFIKSFQLENYDALFELFPPREEVIAVFEEMMPEGPEKDKILNNLDKVFSSRIDQYYRSEFKRILDKGKSVEVDWRRLKLIDSEYEYEHLGVYTLANPTYLTCKNKNTIYTIEINCIRLRDGWYVLPLIGEEARLGYWADPQELKAFRAKRKNKKKQERKKSGDRELSSVEPADAL